MAKESVWVMSFKEAALATAACAVVGSVLTNPQSNWYEGLRKPWFQPPGFAFPVVWTLLYGTTALGAAGTLAKRAKAVSPTDSAPFVAYAAWCSFATLLSGSVAGLNRKA